MLAFLTLGKIWSRYTIRSFAPLGVLVLTWRPRLGIQSRRKMILQIGLQAYRRCRRRARTLGHPRPAARIHVHRSNPISSCGAQILTSILPAVNGLGTDFGPGRYIPYML